MTLLTQEELAAQEVLMYRPKLRRVTLRKRYVSTTKPISRLGVGALIAYKGELLANLISRQS